MVPCTKSQLFEVPSTFLALIMVLAWWLGPFNRAKKVSGTSKSLDFVPGPFRILEMAPVSDFQGLFSNYPDTFTAQCHWYFYAQHYTLFRAVFWGFWCFRDPPPPYFWIVPGAVYVAGQCEWMGGEIVYLIITTFASQSWEEGGMQSIVNSQCSGLIEMGGVVVKWTEFCYAYYVLHSCIKS